jgi:hypothetical protein
MLAAFTVSITGKQQKISISLIFSFKSIKFTDSAWRNVVRIAIKMGRRPENAQRDEFTYVATSPRRWRCYDDGNFPHNNTMP